MFIVSFVSFMYMSASRRKHAPGLIRPLISTCFSLHMVPLPTVVERSFTRKVPSTFHSLVECSFTVVLSP